MQFVIVELNKFIGKLDGLVDQREAWCYFLKRSDELDQQTSQELAKKGRDMGRTVKNLWNLYWPFLVDRQTGRTLQIDLPIFCRNFVES